MNRVELLLGNAEELLNSFIEAAVQDVFGGRAKVSTRRTGRVDELIAWSARGRFDLVILIPDNLFTKRGETGSLHSVVTAIHKLRASSSAIIALPVCGRRRQTEQLLLKAGADCVIELPFDLDDLKSAVERLVQRPAGGERLCPRDWIPVSVQTAA